jgi:hypothetical protein
MSEVKQRRLASKISTSSAWVRECLICGCDLTDTHPSRKICSKKQCQTAWKKETQAARLSDPAARKEHNAKHNAFKKKPSYIAKDRAARIKRESVPANRKKLNAYQVEYHHTRMLDPAYRDAVNAGARRRYYAKKAPPRPPGTAPGA